MLRNLYDWPVLPRIGLLWVGFMAALWAIFAVGIMTNPQAWHDVALVSPESGWGVFWFVILNNLVLLVFITIGNLFVRFGSITPGLVILGIQAIVIGWTGGTNGFSEPFQTVAAANDAFLRIGLWETTAYVLICAITLTKSCLVSDGFPAKRWLKSIPITALRFTGLEIGVGGLALFALIAAASMEAFALR